ncbi:hypothetical protein V4U86_19315 [Mycobacterium sp. AMU20-3851]|uniref:hypothetical protein n=1 Tax=Mycobacterium sp. AMU20-3851 TaxID=3122055 RepID=UPI003754E2A5
MWSDRYIPFQNLTESMLVARRTLHSSLRSLDATDDQILHASYAGYKPDNMDVENLLLYNIDQTIGGCFKPSTRHGVRFELASSLRGTAPSGRRYPCSYKYELTSRDGWFDHWQPTRGLASFSDVDLGGFPSAKRLEQVWLAIHGAEAERAEKPIAGAERYAVLLTIGQPSSKMTCAHPGLVKGLIDGTVAAFQSHPSNSPLDEVADRLARITGRPANRLMQLLQDDSLAVLGTQPLIHLFGRAGVQWSPADHLLTAGQVLCRPVSGTNWTLSGEIHAVEPVP